MDHSKFGLEGMHRICSLSDCTGVVTDYGFNEREKAILKQGNARIISI